MLLSLTIKNIALIEDLTISLHEGFHVLTGETGAGKSIIVDAVTLVLGGRADRELIRTGSDRAYVEALFDIRDNVKVMQLLSQQEMEAEDGLISISREISQSGRNICRVMGMVVSLGFLKEITATLMDVHGQHEHQYLMDEGRHLLYLDGFGDGEHQKLVQAVADALSAFRAASRELDRMTRESGQREQRMDMLRYQLQELTAAKLVPGEEESLRRELERLRHSVKISTALGRAYESIYAGVAKQLSALALTREALSALEGISGLDEEYEKLKDSLKDLYFDLEDKGLTLRGLLEGAAFDPDRNEQVEARLDLIRRLERKYGPTVEDVIAYAEKIALEYDAFGHMDDTLAELQTQLRKLRSAYEREAVLLTASRKKLAAWFESAMEEQLKQLGMEKTKFSVCFASPNPSKDAWEDQVSFMIAPNPGEPLKPLSKTASGGELSRLMLAIKSIEAKNASVPTMVFDEIDTGISGKIAQVVAEKIAGIASARQVLCVTHLPQIAAMADYHYLVEKRVKGDRTHTDVKELTQEQREAELARMVGGVGGANDSGLTHARSMLKAAAEMKPGLTNGKNTRIV